MILKIYKTEHNLFIKFTPEGCTFQHSRLQDCLFDKTRHLAYSMMDKPKLKFLFGGTIYEF